ncbi:MAG: TIGR04255 family protein [Verrucomicrobiales bacterium]|nr:TIGR04255 family protein [Verrucomicrobiales bacterium]
MTEVAQQTHTYDSPIIEAAISIDCDLAPGATMDEILGNAENRLSEAYPIIEKLQEQEHTIEQTQKGLSHRVVQENKTVRFIRKDKTQVVQFGINGFVFNRLTPYTSLDDYLVEVGELWDVYQQTANPLMINKISMRYINRIVIPHENEQDLDLNSYLTVIPAIMPNEELSFGGIFQSVRFSSRDKRLNAQLTVATENLINEGLSVIVDIEVFTLKNEAPAALSVWMSDIQDLRALKNSIYQTTLTERCHNLFQHP